MYLAVLPHGFTDRYHIFIFFILRKHAWEAFQLIGIVIRVRACGGCVVFNVGTIM